MFLKKISAILLGCFIAVNSFSADGTWTNTAGDRLWSTAGNWASSTIATGNSATAYFISGLSGYTITNRYTGFIIGSMVASNSSGNVTITGETNILNSLSGTSTFNVVTATRQLIMSTALQGTNALFKTGVGTLTLNTNNSYSGGTYIDGGILNVNYTSGGTAGPTNTQNITVYSNAIFQTQRAGQYPINGTLTMNGGGWFENNGFGGTWPGSMILSSNSYVTNAFGVTISGPISGAGSLSKYGTATMTLSASNSFTGGINLYGGQLTITNDYNLGDINGGITFKTNATFRLTGVGVTVSANRTTTIDSGAIGSFSSDNALKVFFGPLVGSGIYSNAASTSFAFTNANNTFTGDIYAGYETRIASIGDASSVYGLNGTAGFTYNGSIVPLILTNRQFKLLGGSSAINDIINASGSSTNTLTILQPLLNQATANRTLQLGGINTGTNIFWGNITNNPSSVVSLTKAGAGTWALNGTNNYLGDTTVSAGTLIFNGIDSIPQTTLRMATSSKAILNYSGTKTINGLWLNNVMQPSGTYGTNNVTYTNTTYFQSNGIVNVQWGPGTWTNLTGGNWSDAGNWRDSLISTGEGATAYFTNAVDTTITNTYTAFTNTSFVFSNANYNIVGGTNVLNGWSGSSAGLSTFTVATNRTATIQTVLQGTNAVTKAGTGILTLTGTNSYFGPLSVSAGNLIINGGSVTNSGALAISAGSSITITNGATLKTTLPSFTSFTSFYVEGGNAVTSLWDLSNNDLYTANNATLSNIFITVDGNGYEGSAVISNINILVIGRSGLNNLITLTNGALMRFNNEFRMGSQYYSSGYVGATNNTMTIIGGAANSKLIGNGGNGFYIGYTERPGAAYNKVIVGAGGILTNVGYVAANPEADFAIGDANNNTVPVIPVNNNELMVDGGKAYLVRNLNIGIARSAAASSVSNSLEIANGGMVNVPGGMVVGWAYVPSTTSSYNNVSITGGSSLTTVAGTNRIGTASGTLVTRSDYNSVTVTGNSVLDYGNDPLYIGLTSSNSVYNSLNVTNATVTNISVLTMFPTNIISLGIGGNIFAAAVTNNGIMSVSLGGKLNVSGNLTITNTTLNATNNGAVSGTYTIATYGTLTGTFISTNMPTGWTINYGGGQITITTPTSGSLDNVVVPYYKNELGYQNELWR